MRVHDKKKISEKIVPKNCSCGRAPILVAIRGGKMYTCPNPMKCKRNARTMWHKHEQQAANEWNGLITQHKKGREKYE